MSLQMADAVEKVGSALPERNNGIKTNKYLESMLRVRLFP
jgi:hypothetical protein